MEKAKPEFTAVTVNDKAAAFDRIAEAYLDVPAGNPTPEEVRDAETRLLEVVGREVQQLHPSYRA